MLLITQIIIWLVFRSVNAAFYPGIPMVGEHEMPELNDWMTVRKAVMLCETNLECAGFAFIGSLSFDIEYDIFFFRFITFDDYDEKHIPLNTRFIVYCVNRLFATYSRKVARGPRNVVKTTKANRKLFTQEIEDECNADVNCTAIAISSSSNSLIKVYEIVDLASMDDDPDWTTIVKLDAPSQNVEGIKAMNDLDFCCYPINYVSHNNEIINLIGIM